MIHAEYERHKFDYLLSLCDRIGMSNSRPEEGRWSGLSDWGILTRRLLFLKTFVVQDSELPLLRQGR